MTRRLRLLGVVGTLILLSCGDASSPSDVTPPPVEATNWDNLGTGPEVAEQASLAWSGRYLFVFGGYRRSSSRRSVARNGHLYDSSTGRWSALPSPPGDPIVGPHAAYADGRFLVLGTRCPNEAIRFDEGEATCDSGRGVALWFDAAAREWLSLAVPDWIAGPIELLLSPASTLRSLGTDGPTLYLAGERLLVALDVASGRFSELYDASPGLLDACKAGDRIVVVRSPVAGVEDRGLETLTLDTDGGEMRDVDPPFDRADFFALGCGTTGAHLYANSDEPRPRKVDTYELTSDRWAAVDGWPAGLGLPSATATASGVELAWARTQDADGSLRTVAFRGEGWTAVSDQVELADFPYTVVDVGDGVVHQSSDAVLHHQKVS